MSERAYPQRCGAAAGPLDYRVMAQPAQALATAPIPPQNLDAEESVLGAMMLSAAAIEAVSELVDAGDFYRQSHARIYLAALDLYQHGQPVDAITIADKLDERGELGEVGGKERVHELAALVPASSNARHYARIVREMATLRGLTIVGEQIQRLGWDRPGETTELVDQAERLVFDLAQHRIRGSFDHVEVIVRESFEQITKMYESGGEMTGTPTGFRGVDPMTSGLQPGNLVVVAGRPSMGKSAFALGVASNLGIRLDVPVADLHARDVEDRGRAAIHVRRCARGAPAPPRRSAHAGGLVAARQGVRHAHEGPDLRGRHAHDDDARDPREGPAAEGARAEASA